MYRLLLLTLVLATALVALEPAPSTAAARRAAPGGTAISHPTRDGTTHICTSGFNAKRNGRSFVITAGHCGPVGWRWRRYSTGRRIGKETDRRYALSRGLDWAIIRSNGTHRLPPRVRDRGRVRAVAGVARVRRGMRVCLYRGWTGGTRCGRLTRVGPRMVTADVVARRGDSGSPLFHRRRNGTVTAVGILSSRSQGHTNYQRITVPLRQASLRLKTS
jgi:hypothetical protein